MDKRTRAKFTALTAKVNALEKSMTTGISAKGVPKGGNTGQVLAKRTDADYSTEWVDAPEPAAITNAELAKILT